MSREESRAITREKLLEAAFELFGRDGYAGTSVENITEAAGFSKGAAYSNFESKESIFLEVLERQGQASLDPLLRSLDHIDDPDVALDHLAAWANDRSSGGSWSLTILEHARTAEPTSSSLKRQKEILRDHWQQLGRKLLDRFPNIEADALTLGALLHEIAYAPAMTFVGEPKAGDLLRLAVRHILR